MHQLTDPAEIVAERHRRVTRAMDALIDWRVIPTALLFSGLAAALTVVALGAPAGWLLVAATIALGDLAHRRFRAAQRGAAADLASVGATDATTTARARDALAALPPWWLEAAEVSSPAQLERMLHPTRAEAAAQLREQPLPNLALMALPVVWFAGMVLGVFGPGVHLIVFREALSADDTRLLVAVVASIPLIAVLPYFARAIAACRTMLANAVADARDQLPRLWDADPGFDDGKVVIRFSGGYGLDLTRLAMAVEKGPVRTRIDRVVPALSAAVVLITGVAVVVLTLG